MLVDITVTVRVVITWVGITVTVTILQEGIDDEKSLNVAASGVLFSLGYE